MGFQRYLLAATALAALVSFAPAASAQNSGRTIWEGFHLGAHAGWSDADYGISQTAPGLALVTISDSADAFAGGFVYGSSWQFGQWVLGTDSNYSFADAKTGLSVTAGGLAARADIDWSSSTRARAGYLVTPNTMLFGTVGVAFASIDVSGTLIAGGSSDDKAVGLVFGGGFETTMGNRWFARVEYLHTDYSEEKFAQVGGGTFDVDLDTDVIRGAIGYRFDWSPLDFLKK